MKRIALLIVVALLTIMSSVAQVIKLDAGASFSSMQDDTPLHQFTGNNTGFTALLGIDWLEHEYFYLSSQVGYMATGGTDHVYLTNEDGLQSDMLDWHMRRDVSLGINFSYLPDITRQASYLNQTTRNNIFTLGISLGYLL